MYNFPSERFNLNRFVNRQVNRTRATWITVVIIIGLTLAAPLLAPYAPERAIGRPLQAPSIASLFGTDGIGRDTFTRTVWGARRTLSAAAGAVTVAMITGVTVGLLLTTFRGHLIGAVLELATDALAALPGLLIPFAIVALTGTGATQVAFAVGVGLLPYTIRLIAAQAHAVSISPYIEAARSLGGRERHIVIRHILPALVPTLINLMAVNTGWAILNGASLHFLGLGGDPSVPEWGSMIAESRLTIRLSVYPLLAPALCLVMLLFLMYSIADGYTNRSH